MCTFSPAGAILVGYITFSPAGAILVGYITFSPAGAILVGYITSLSPKGIALSASYPENTYLRCY